MFRKLCKRIAFWRWYLLEFRPIAGADGAGEGGGEGAAGGDGSAAGSEGGDGNDGGDGSGEGSGGDGGDGGGSSESGAGDGGEETVSMPKGEAERLKREVAKAAKDKRERERKAAEAAGEHDKVVQGVEGERDEEKTRADQAESDLAKFKADAEVRKVAHDLHFHDAEDAVLRVPSEVSEKGEAAVEKFLRDLTTKSPHLVGEGSTRSGAPVGGGNSGDPGKGQLSSTEGMSPEAIAKAVSEGRLKDYMSKPKQ